VIVFVPGITGFVRQEMLWRSGCGGQAEDSSPQPGLMKST